MKPLAIGRHLIVLLLGELAIEASLGQLGIETLLLQALAGGLAGYVIERLVCRSCTRKRVVQARKPTNKEPRLNGRSHSFSEGTFSHPSFSASACMASSASSSSSRCFGS